VDTAVSDFQARRDLSSVTTFSDPNAKFDFLFEAADQLIVNESRFPMEASFDGQNVHAYLPATGPSSAIGWTIHFRKFVFVRRATGSGGAAAFVQVIANTR
jgi:hypothetical protein